MFRNDRPHKMMLESSRYDKWDRGGGGGAGAGGGPWGRESRDTRDARDSRDREARDARESRESRDARESREARDRERDRDRERERQARAHQMSHAYAAEADASSLFPAPIRVTGNRDPVVRQIQIKLGDYSLAQTLLDDPSKSIGICAEPPSPAPCHPSRRENEFKKPAHAPQNGRIHHRPYYNKNESLSSSGTTAHRPPPLRIPNGVSQNAIDSSQSHIENILKEMKALPTPVSGIAATPRKELENKFVFNHFTNKVQENPRLASSDLKTPPTKPALDNRISNSRSSPSPDVNKDLGLSESDDEVAATNTRLEPILSPLGSGASPSSASESSPSDSESESSSAESSGGGAEPQPQPPPTTQRPSWCLSNFAPPPPAQPDLNNVLAVVAKERPSPISELSDSEASSPSPEARRRRPNRISVASSDDESSRPNPVRTQTSPAIASQAGASQSTGSKRGRPPKSRPSDEHPAKRKRGRPPKTRPVSPTHDSEPEPDQPQVQSQDAKSRILGRVFVPKKPDECGAKGGKGGKGKGGKGKGKGQVTIIESGAEDYEKSQRDRSVERRNEEALARVSPPQEPDTITRKREAERMAYERIQERKTTERSEHRRPDERISVKQPADRISDRISDVRANERLPPDRSADRLTDRLSGERHSSGDRERKSNDRLSGDKIDRMEKPIDRIPDKLDREKLAHERLSMAGLASDKSHLPGDKSHDRLSSEKLSHDRSSSDKYERGDKLPQERLSVDRVPGDKLALDRDRLDRVEPKSYVCAEADVGFVQCPLQNSLSTASSGRGRPRLMVRVSLSQLRADTQRALRARRAAPPPPPRSPLPPPHQVEAAATNHERTAAAGQTPIYYSYFERLPADTLSDEERDHKYYLEEAKRLRGRADAEQEPLSRVMLYLESVLCFVLTGRVLELELDTKRAFTIYRETIEYIKSIHSMPQRFRASPHSTFSKLDILSLRVQALLYLRMFKMYNREVKEYYKIVQEYQQKHNSQPACAESVSSVSSVSPLSPTPSPASVGSLGSLGSGSVGSGSLGSGSASSGYCSLAHAVPAHAHHALLQLTKYYTFLYVAHDLWEQADCLCRLKPNQDLFIAVDRKCGPLTLFSTFRHLVQYVRHAISLLKNAQRE
ncbi:AF4/FMR2 family member 3 isoform X2 [Aricia agestis]|uniref:AF4/FMR2 family member 3 isoform X2 n=1 Tax=Aricia agestis TaxID=91739 RepID=UPI001C209DC6|nr:AF4/FMR2 family member 3 isoform X2 [Aricia agestis]